MKFCSRCGKQCLNNDKICPVCGQVLSVNDNMSIGQTSKNILWIMLTFVGVIIIGLFVVFFLLNVLSGNGSGVSRQQSDADVAMLEGEYTYSRTEQVNDDVVDIFYEINTKNDLVDYTYECQMRYVRNESNWNLEKKQMKLLDYEWTIAGTTWEREVNMITKSSKSTVYIEKISQDSITIQYVIQDSSSEVKQGEETVSLEKMLDEDSNIYVDEDGTLHGTVWIESETIPMKLGLYFYEMAICSSDFTGTMYPFTRTDQAGDLINKR